MKTQRHHLISEINPLPVTFHPIPVLSVSSTGCLACRNRREKRFLEVSVTEETNFSGLYLLLSLLPVNEFSESLDREKVEPFLTLLLVCGEVKMKSQLLPLIPPQIAKLLLTQNLRIASRGRRDTSTIGRAVAGPHTPLSENFSSGLRCSGLLLALCQQPRLSQVEICPAPIPLGFPPPLSPPRRPVP